MYLWRRKHFSDTYVEIAILFKTIVYRNNFNGHWSFANHHLPDADSPYSIPGIFLIHSWKKIASLPISKHSCHHREPTNPSRSLCQMTSDTDVCSPKIQLRILHTYSRFIKCKCIVLCLTGYSRINRINRLYDHFWITYCINIASV